MTKLVFWLKKIDFWHLLGKYPTIRYPYILDSLEKRYPYPSIHYPYPFWKLQSHHRSQFIINSLLPFFAQSKNLLSGQTFPDRDIYLTNLYYSKHKDILGKRPIKSLHRAPSGRSTCKYPNCNCRKKDTARLPFEKVYFYCCRPKWNLITIIRSIIEPAFQNCSILKCQLHFFLLSASVF